VRSPSTTGSSFLYAVWSKAFKVSLEDLVLGPTTLRNLRVSVQSMPLISVLVPGITTMGTRTDRPPFPLGLTQRMNQNGGRP